MGLRLPLPPFDLQLSCLLKEQLLEPALNLTVHCCGLEFRVLNGYDSEVIAHETSMNCCVQTFIVPSPMIAPKKSTVKNVIFIFIGDKTRPLSSQIFVGDKTRLVHEIDSSSMETWWNLDFRSNFENIFAPPILLMIVFMPGMEY
ncbi:hypothetical protein Tco_0895451 [Tanacetum coccineum]|uniref:Uncharacterized protein n=1 Tax=Tanacetum coccineum TaxID=301880 RepID=A0ABQ5CKW4_9ASTR